MSDRDPKQLAARRRVGRLTLGYDERMPSQSHEKITAIYALRDAVETKVRAEVAVDARPTPAAKDRLLDATLEVEAKTQNAIEVCHECGHDHHPDQPHTTCTDGSNVITVDFRAHRPDEAG